MDSYERMQRDTERRMREQRRRTEERMREQRRRTEERMREQRRRTEERMESLRKDAERRQREMQQRQERQQRDREARFEKMERERSKRFERLERDRQAREKAYRESTTGFNPFRAETDREAKKRGIFSRLFKQEAKKELRDDQSRPAYEGVFDFSQLIDEAAPRTPRPRDEISPAERTRRNIMNTLPPDTTKVLETFEQLHLRSVIATVYAAREANSERTDWDIYIGYRQAIEIENPDPVLVEKTQIAGLLLEGTRSEARFPF